ncbi:MAG: phage tail spike protein [Paeniclostridium sordellii]|nr:phage tail spike protein [Paeniclostridium sordellii]
MIHLKGKNKKKIAGLVDYKDLCIEKILESGDQLLSFSYPKKSKYYFDIVEEGYITTKENEYVIKEKNVASDYTVFKCILNLEDLEGKPFERYASEEQTIEKSLALALAGTGWIVGKCSLKKKRTVRMSNCSSLEIIKEIKKTYRCDLVFNTLTRTIDVYEHLGEDKGAYFIDSLNLKELSIQGNSYDYCTRIIPIGKDNLRISNINNGKEYVENYQYSNKIKTIYWKDDRYTIVENLKEDAEAKLDEISKPYRAYAADIINLAKLNDKYKNILDYKLGDTITLISKDNKFRDKQRIVKIKEHPDEHELDSVELANTTLSFEEIQTQFKEAADTVNNITSDNGTIDGSTIDSIKTEQISDFETSVAKITDLTVINAKINNLEAFNVTISGELTAVKGTIGTLTANVATIDKLTVTHSASINDLQSNKASITQLQATNATIQVLEANVGKIETLVNGNLSSNNLQAGSITARELAANAITAGSSVIGEGAIGNAQISNLSATKLNAGTIDTSRITIAGPNSNLRLRGNRLQVFVGIGNNQVERVSIGDIFGDGSKYGFLVRGADGQTVIMDENGVKREGITNGSITNDKISGDANIDGAKLNINSVVTKINGATTSISGTKIDINGTNLSTKLSQQDTVITQHKSIIDSHTTSITANTNAIKLKVDNQTYITDKTNFTNTLNKATSDISLMKGQIALKVERTDITNAINNIKIGGRNFIRETKDFVLDQSRIRGWWNNGNHFTFSKEDGYTIATVTSSGLTVSAYKSIYSSFVECKTNETITFSTWIKVENVDAWDYKYPFIVEFYDAQNNRVEYKDVNINLTNNPTLQNNKWTRIYFTFTPQNSNIVKCGLRLSLFRNGKVSYKMAQVEFGNKATDYTEAPEDIINKIDTKVSTAKAEIKITTDTIAQNVSNLTTTVNTKANGSTVNTLSNKVGSLETSINGIKGQVSSLETTTSSTNTKVNKAQADAIKGINDAKLASDKAISAQNTANTANSQANANKSNITTLTTEITTVKSNIATLDINLKGITQRVSSTETNITTIRDAANSANSKIDNLKIGGRNLFLNSGFTNGSKYFHTYACNNVSVVDEPTAKSKKALSFISTGGGIYQRNGGPTNVEPFLKDLKLIVSGYFKCSSNAKLTVGLEGTASKQISPSSPNTWTYFEVAVVANGTSHTFIFYGVNGNAYHLKDLKLEEGNKATDWTPAPEDVQANIDSNKTEITKTNNKVASIETNLSSITSRVSSVETTTANINSKVSNLSTRMNVAEQKITDASIVSIVSSQFYTKGQTDNLYASKTQLTQLDNKFKFQITNSGNMNYGSNTDFKKGLVGWETYNSNYISSVAGGWNVPTGSGAYIVGQGDKAVYLKQTVKVPPKAEKYYASAYLNCTNFLNIGGRPEESLWHFYVVLRYTDGTGETKKVPCWSDSHAQGTWKRQSLEFIRNPNKTVSTIDVYLYVRYVQGNFYMGMVKVETDQLGAWVQGIHELNTEIIELDDRGMWVRHEDGSAMNANSKSIDFTNENGRKKMSVKNGGLNYYNYQSGLFVGLDSSTQFSTQYSKFGMQKFASKHCSFYDILHSPTTENDENLKSAKSIFRICFENLEGPKDWRTVKGIHSYDRHRFHEGIDLMMKNIDSCATIFMSNTNTRRKITTDDKFDELQLGFSTGGLIMGQTRSDGSVETAVKIYEKFYMDIHRSCNFMGNEITNAVIRTNYSLRATSPGGSVGADTISVETMLLQEDFSEYDETNNTVVVNINEAVKSVYANNKRLENENEQLKQENKKLNEELAMTKNALDAVLMDAV